MLDYDQLYQGITDHLVKDNPTTTKAITKSIKQFFGQNFKAPCAVLQSGGNNSEFLVDLLVSTFDSRNLVEKEARTFRLKATELKALVAVESEIGGPGGGICPSSHEECR